jgi:D-glycero-D-manno-heptose 1,7-bisphosphate phosphatase
LKFLAANKKRAIFLDRDGVINVDTGYVGHWDDFEFKEGVFKLLKALSSKGFLLFIVTNQSGIGRGYFSEEQFHILMDKMLAAFSEKKINIDGIYYCPHFESSQMGRYNRRCECRKPKPGMILEAAAEFDLALEGSILIGDKTTDIEAGAAAGVGFSILLDERGIEPFHDGVTCKSLDECLSLIESKLN